MLCAYGRHMRTVFGFWIGVLAVGLTYMFVIALSGR
jgi:hypothetical protein